MGRVSTSVLEALAVVSTLLSGMTSAINKKRSRMAQKHAREMKALTKKSRKATQKRCANGYNLFVSTNVQRTQTLQVIDVFVIQLLVYMTYSQN
jgi:hypothetical protein